MYTVGLYTLGCKVSQYETEAIAEEFLRLGFSVRPYEEKNDLYVVNTCTVTAESDRKCRQIIRRAIKNNPDAFVMVTGCYSQRSPERIAKIPGVLCVIGTENKMTLPKIAVEILKKRKNGTPCDVFVSVTDVSKASFEPMCIENAPRTRAYVKIEDGCESKCTYCAISAARGRVRSKAPDDVIREVEGLAVKGTLEAVLTGIETASYGRDFDFKYDLSDLLSALDSRKSISRIRLGSLAPELITDAFVEKIKDLKILAPHFHLSVQSGSDAVLRSMKRRYNSRAAMHTIEKIRESINGATFTTDIMVGFPGESEEDFEASLSFVRRARFLDAHVFAYSRRVGTEATDYPSQIPESIKRERSERMIREKNLVRDSVLDECIALGAQLSAIAETKREDGRYTGHTDTYIEVVFESENDVRGRMVSLLPVSHKNGILHCNLIGII